jgi:Flp pilus assembly CpaE family ATPase
VLVSTPVPVSLRLARTLVQEIKELRGGEKDDIDLLINMAGLAKSSEVPKKDIEEALGCKVSGYIFYDTKTFLNNESQGRKLTDDKEARAIIETTLLPIARNVLSVSSPEGDQNQKSGGSGFFTGLLGKLSK